MPGPWIAFGRDGALECDDPLPIVRTTQRDVSSTMNEAEPVLAIPEGWVLDHASRECLYRRLSRAGSACAAVGAEWSELPPGTSHRVWSERLALRPESEVWPVSDLSVHGAAMIRPDVPFEVGDHFVRVERGRWSSMRERWSTTRGGRSVRPRTPHPSVVRCRHDPSSVSWR